MNPEVEISNANHGENIRRQFSQRILTYETAANWMLSEDLIRAQRESAGSPDDGHNLALDLCCGTGIVGRNLLDLGWKVHGVDLTPEMAAVAQRYFPVTVGSVSHLVDIPDGSIDLVTLRQSFMLVDGPRAMTEIARVLKPGGRFILIHSINFGAGDDPVYSQVQWARHINQTAYYHRTDLETLFADHGLEVVGSRTLRIRESVDRWLKSAPELPSDLRARIRSLIADAPVSYKEIRGVAEVDGELFEDWNWLILTGKKG